MRAFGQQDKRAPGELMSMAERALGGLFAPEFGKPRDFGQGVADAGGEHNRA